MKIIERRAASCTNNNFYSTLMISGRIDSIARRLESVVTRRFRRPRARHGVRFFVFTSRTTCVRTSFVSRPRVFKNHVSDFNDRRRRGIRFGRTRGDETCFGNSNLCILLFSRRPRGPTFIRNVAIWPLHADNTV